MPDAITSDGRMATCFRIGKWLGRLRGELIRAVFCNRLAFFQMAMRAWESLEVELVALDPLAPNKSLRSRVRDDRRSFQDWYFDPDSHGFAELHSAALESPGQLRSQSADEAAQSVIDALHDLVPSAAGEYEG